MISPRTLAIVAGGSVMAGLWYLAIAGHGPEAAAPEAAASVGVDEPDLVSVDPRKPMPSAREAASAQAALAADPSALDIAPPSPEELAARAEAFKPIEEQPLDMQEQYFKTSLEGATHTRAMQRDLIDTLEAERDKGDPATRAAVEAQIDLAHKLLAETETEIARYSPHVHESQ
jgi:hypothetical protein